MAANIIVNMIKDNVFVIRNAVLRQSSGMDEVGEPRWELALTLLLCWTLTFLALIKGIKLSSKVH